MPQPDDSDTPQTSSSSDSTRAILWRLSKELITTLVIVGFIVGILFAYTGLWPPFVSIISGSMEPDLERGDLVMIMDSDRVDSPDEYTRHGIVTHDRGEDAGITSFGDHGHVIVFTPSDSPSTHNIIHRAMFYVEEGNDWTDRLDPKYASTTDCTRLQYCPAPYDGFITKGDANAEYDQTSEISAPIPPENVHGIAQFDVPYAGNLNLLFGTPVDHDA